MAERTRQSGELILIRHAESEWNAAGRWQGHADPPLTALGLSQAEGLVATLRRQLIDRLYVSDLQRAIQTARPLAKARGLDLETDAAFRELDIGRWSGLVRSEIETVDPALLTAFESGNPEIRPGGGETRLELRQRARARVTLIAAEHPGQRIAVVTHLGFIKALLPEAQPANTGAVVITLAEALRARSSEVGQGTIGRV